MCACISDKNMTYVDTYSIVGMVGRSPWGLSDCVLCHVDDVQCLRKQLLQLWLLMLCSQSWLSMLCSHGLLRHRAILIPACRDGDKIVHECCMFAGYLEWPSEASESKPSHRAICNKRCGTSPTAWVSQRVCSIHASESMGQGYSRCSSL